MLGSSEMVIVVVLVLVLFGGSQIPKLAKNLGLAQKELKDAMKDDDDPAPPTVDGSSTPRPTSTTTPSPASAAVDGPTTAAPTTDATASGAHPADDPAAPARDD
ncbi:twin-arginine translocase TatA/TatE family subunit [Ilumatobacter sp.]|uniref:twin-arginine translocase TatA/TatE family subunit n=1 Tax=Ilumatobacter sp. TaxID=1967498 RepID=UPI003B51A896